MLNRNIWITVRVRNRSSVTSSISCPISTRRSAHSARRRSIYRYRAGDSPMDVWEFNSLSPKKTVSNFSELSTAGLYQARST